jgi:hypothetical protein
MEATNIYWEAVADVFVKRKCQHFLIENDVTDRVEVALL